MVSSKASELSNGEFKLIPGKSLSLWKIRSRAYFYGQRKVEQIIDIRDAFMSAKVRFNIDPKENVEDSFLNHKLSIGYTEHYPLRDYLNQIREKHKKELAENA